MATYKSYSQIVKGMVDRLKLVQPGLDTKPGSVSRDLFIDLQADELQKLYNLISLVSDKQSFATAVGSDLDKIARNFGFSRKRGSTSSGTVIFSVNYLDFDVEISEGTIVSTRSGVSYRTIGNYSMLSSQKNIYSANASRISKQLSVAGSASSFAIEIPVEAINAGQSGNIGSYQIVSQSAPFNFSVTNISAISGGSDIESDSEFRRRFLSSFSGSNVGTSLGYLNAVLSVAEVLDALVVEPGNSLMMRDGTEVLEGDLGSRRISKSGSGGKVDIYVLGKKLQQVSESFIFFNKSSDGDISSTYNDYVLGSFNQDTSLTSLERRVQAFKTGNIPYQPVDSMISVIGSESGLLAEGETYELVKDTNSDTGGSPFGFDKIRFINNYKTVNLESTLKTSFNSSDPLRFNDAFSTAKIFENIGIENENSSVDRTDRRYVILNHKNVSSVSRVFNFTTGELYSVENLFIENGINDTGVIQISGKKLPSVTDRLKVNYVWQKEYDKDMSYKLSSSTVDWSSPFYKESRLFLLDGSRYSIITEDEITDVKNVYLYSEEQVVIKQSNTSFYVDLSNGIKNILSVKIGHVDVINTEKKDYSFVGSRLYFSTDSGVLSGETCTVVYNYKEIFSFDGISGNFQGKKIFLPEETLFSEEDYSSINDFYVSNKKVIVKYFVKAEKMIPAVGLQRLPLFSSDDFSKFYDSSQNDIQNSYKNFQNTSDFFRYSPSSVRVSASSISSHGEIKISGVTLEKRKISIEVSKVFDGLKFNLSGLIGGNGIAKVSSVYINSNANMSSYRIKNNEYSDDALTDSSLGNFEFSLANNTYNKFSYSISDMAEIEVYSYTTNDHETLYFYEDSSLETEKVFVKISQISVSSGFISGSIVSGSISAEFGNQPSAGTQYFSSYKFTAPKDGERIFVKYNHNSAIVDATASIETVRPITADVLVKEAYEIFVDVKGTIVVSEDYIDDSETIKENVIDQVTNLLSTNVLGGIVDYSDIIRAITNVTGVESADVSLFNFEGQYGRRDYIRALDNQSISPNIIDISVVTRKDFRIS